MNKKKPLTIAKLQIRKLTISNMISIKTVSKIILYLGIFLAILGITMFIYVISMFSATGEFSEITRHLGELSMVFWLPVTFIGVLVTVAGAILMIVTKRKSKAQA
ncbi:MAG: hypothetical protein EOO96_08260 [Pedobacter sp.]|nr:MAG: hypothetical protein EOO96_08260 [Pedobacter sp.]